MVSLKSIFIEKVNNFFLTSGILLFLFILNFGAVLYIFGPIGAIILGHLILTTFYYSPKMSQFFLFKKQGGRVIQRYEAPELYQMLSQIIAKEGPDQLPQVVLLPSNEINALTVSEGKSHYIAITKGLLENLNEREIYNVFAHEVSHIINKDLRIQSFARVLGLVASMFSTFGLILITLFLPLFLFFPYILNPPFILYLYFGPTLSNLLILKLSRTREFLADLKAVEITQDPIGLANALKKIAYYNPVGIFQVFGMRQKRRSTGGIFSTHPDPEERIQKLISYNR